MNEKKSHKYDDIINLEHPTSTTHPRMDALSRAAQFAPFAALTGLDDAIEETGKGHNEDVLLETEHIPFYD